MLYLLLLCLLVLCLCCCIICSSCLPKTDEASASFGVRCQEPGDLRRQRLRRCALSSSIANADLCALRAFSGTPVSQTPTNASRTQILIARSGVRKASWSLAPAAPGVGAGPLAARSRSVSFQQYLANLSMFGIGLCLCNATSP